MPLTDAAIRNAKPSNQTTRLHDERGLYLEISSTGGKWWRFKYRVGGKEKRISFGVYPAVSLKDARERRDEARLLVIAKVDPSQHRRAEKLARADRAANSFEVMAREWFAKDSKPWSEGHSSRVKRRLERDIFPWIGDRPIAEITAPELLAVIRRIEIRGAGDTAHRALGDCGRVFLYGIATGRCDRDLSSDLRGALAPIVRGHFAAATKPEDLAQILRLIDVYHGTLPVCCAFRLAPLVFLRPGELRKAEWSEFDLDNAVWNIPAERMKEKRAHIVPLSRQAVAILVELHPLTGHGKYVFPGARSSKRPMSDNAILAAMRRMEISADDMTGHGFRASARTILDEVLGVRPDIIEHQLAHAVHGPLGRAYNRTQFLPERRAMMQKWADYLDTLKTGTELSGFPTAPDKDSTR